MRAAFVSEIYESVQGEGPFAGERQIFLRLAGCPLRCRYCDTPASLVAAGHDRWEVEDVFRRIQQIGRKTKTKTVSVTGGEPLVYAPFLKDLFSILKKNRFRIYLETAGIHPSFLKMVNRFCDVIAMDIKLPSAVGRSFWKEHSEFLKTAGEKAFVKIILDNKSNINELKQAVSVIKKTRPKTLLILQPASPMAPSRPPTMRHISDAARWARSQGLQTLVMPQQQKIWKVR